MNNYTKIVDKNDFAGATDIWSCNDCGAHAGSSKDIKHHATCSPAESKKWEEFYNEANECETACPYPNEPNCDKCRLN